MEPPQYTHLHIIPDKLTHGVLWVQPPYQQHCFLGDKITGVEYHRILFYGDVQVSRRYIQGRWKDTFHIHYPYCDNSYWACLHTYRTHGMEVCGNINNSRGLFSKYRD